VVNIVMVEFDGEWQLDRYQHITDEIAYDDNEDGPRVTEIQAWLIGTDGVSVDAMPRRTGLRMRMKCGSFSESATAFDELMFDVSGIQVNDYRPMSGNLEKINGLTFLVADVVSRFAASDTVDDVVVRYHDGDTTVCDTLRVIDEYLVRQTSVVTDEIYLDRMLLAYRRVGES